MLGDGKETEAPRRELLFKVLVIGDVATGKTTLIKRYVHGMFMRNYKATIGVDFALKIMEWDAHTTVRLQLWDIAGQERFGNMTRVFYKEAMAAFVVFDVTRENTYEAVKKWKLDLDTKVTLPGTDEAIPVVLLANKIDLVGPEWVDNNKDKLDKLCEEHGFVGWFATSAAENKNVDNAGRFLTSVILDKIVQINKEERNRDIIVVGDNFKNPEKSTCLC